MEETIGVSFASNTIKIRLLEWEVKTPGNYDATVYWDPEFEFNIADDQELGSKVLTIDCSMFLRKEKNDYLLMIRVRSVINCFEIKDRERLIAFLTLKMERAIDHTRAICIDKQMQENISLPIIPRFEYQTLWDYVTVRLFYSTVDDFSYERRRLGKKLTAIVGNKVIGIEEIRNYTLLFEAKPYTHPESIIAGFTTKEAGMNGSMSFNFDYEHYLGNDWKFHIDMGFNILPVAEIKQRTSFAVSCKIQELFSMSVLNTMVEEALLNMNAAFKEHCKINKIEFDAHVPITKEMIQSNSSNIIRMYNGHRRKDDINNSKLLTPGQSMTIGGNTLLVVKGTFMIIDELLFRNPHFDHKHNLQALEGVMVMESFYHTIKANCLQLEKEKIQLTWLHTVLFYILVDIALQMLLSDHADTLQPALEANNFTAFRQQEYIKFGNEFYGKLNKSLKESGGSISNLKERKDWAAIIR